VAARETAAGANVPVSPISTRMLSGMPAVTPWRLKGRDTRLVQECMGHSNVRNTTRYMDRVSGRFHGKWDLAPAHTRQIHGAGEASGLPFSTM
jgi:site-specific recombinase XerD